MELHCFRCKRKPGEIEDVVMEASANAMTPDQYVMEEEGTLNDEGRFCCTACYITIGMPTAPFPGWRAP